MNNNGKFDLIYSRHKRGINTNENIKLAKAVMKALCENLKLPVDTPVAMQMDNFVNDLYYNNKKIPFPPIRIYLNDRKVLIYRGELVFLLI